MVHHHLRGAPVVGLRRCGSALACHVGRGHLRNLCQLQDGNLPDLRHPSREHGGRVHGIPLLHACGCVRRLYDICGSHLRSRGAHHGGALLRLQGRGARDRHPPRGRPNQPPHGLHRQVVHPTGNLDPRGVRGGLLGDAQPRCGDHCHARRRGGRALRLRLAALPALRARAHLAFPQEGDLTSRRRFPP